MIVRMNAPSRASILAKQKAGILLVHQDRVKPFSRTSPKVSIDLANETENRLLKSGKDRKRHTNSFYDQKLYNFTKKLKKNWANKLFIHQRLSPIKSDLKARNDY